MSNESLPIVIRTMTLRQFMAEIPFGSGEHPPLRLELTSQIFYGTPNQQELRLSLTGLTPIKYHDQKIPFIVWLIYSQRITLAPGSGEPWTPKEKDIFNGFYAGRKIVANYLAEQGYEVREGAYAVNELLQIASGRFECLVWERAGEERLTLRAATAEEIEQYHHDRLEESNA